MEQNFKGIIDSTLREGFQFARANFSISEQKKIFSYLTRIGVDYIEVGNPAARKTQEIIIELITGRTSNSPKVLSHIRNNEYDLQKALESRVDGVSILCSVDGDRLSAMNKSLEEYLELLKRNVDKARENSLEVRVGVEDFFSQAFDQSLKIYRAVESLQVDRIGAADTLGRAMPWEVRSRIRELRRHLSTDIEVHFHNDLGHAVSNAITSLKFGANWISTSLVGIGERTGITPLSSLMANLYLLNRWLTRKYNLKLLTEAETYVARICGMEIPMNLMTNPSNGFAHKAGIHLDALMKFGPRKYELFSPNLIGNRRNLILKTHVSGKTEQKDAEEFNRRYE